MIRRHILLLSILHFCVWVPAAEADDPPAIPYDAKKAKASQERERAWLLKTTLTSYQSIGKRSPKWNALVEKALRANVDRIVGSEWDKRDAEHRMYEALKQAEAAGCDDPLIRYYLIRFRPRPKDNSDDDLVKKLYLEAARGLAASKYPEIRKAHAWLNTTGELQFEAHTKQPTEANLKLAATCLDELLKVLAVLAKDKDPNARKELLDLCQLIHGIGSDIGKRKEWFDRVESEVMSKLAKNDPLPHANAGGFLIKYAWDARGKGVAPTVTEEGAKLFKERLTEAERRLTTAWELDKDSAEAAADMVTVCMGLGRDRETMEKWFQRTLEANPNHANVFEAKLNYVHPKWHGSPEELLEFGRQLAKTERWDTMLPLKLPQVHGELANSSGDIAGYFRKQPEVWKEIEPILEGMRKHHPTSPLGASLYLYYAWLSDQNATKALEYVQSQKLELSRGLFRKTELFDAAQEWAKAGAEKDKK